MKKLFFAAVITTSSLCLVSCERCSTCSYAYKLAGQDTTRVFPETCGSKSEVENYEESSRAAAAADNGAVATCTLK